LSQAQASSASTITILTGAVMVDPAHRIGALPDEIEMQRPEHEEGAELCCIEADEGDGRPGERTADQDVADDVDGVAADPALDAEPAAGDDRAQQRRQLVAAHAERGAHQYGEGNAVLRPGVADQHDRHDDDQVAEEDGGDGLQRRHALVEQAGGGDVARNADHHADPQRDIVQPRPGPLPRIGRRQVLVPDVGSLVDLSGHRRSPAKA